VVRDDLLDELTTTLGSRREARWLLEDLDATAPDLATRVARGRELAARRAAGEPLQYVLGHWPFRGLDLLVDGRALIPRPETELLVGLALAQVRARSDGVVVCDLGCGTGAIALSLAVEAAAEGRSVDVHASDVDLDALALARCNAERVGAPGVVFHAGSWYEALPPSLAGRIDVCCANPPYVGVDERPSLGRELDYEPPIALVAPDGLDGTPGLAAIEAVVEGARRWLAPGGALLVEHGDTQRSAALGLAARFGLEVVADHADLAGRPRVLEARAPT
jgi:release factor glutamine methyltransferase